MGKAARRNQIITFRSMPREQQPQQEDSYSCLVSNVPIESYAHDSRIQPARTDQFRLAYWMTDNNPRDDPQYGEVFAQLGRVKEIAAEDGYPEPTDELIGESREVLEWMFLKQPFAYDTTPQHDGSIAIHVLHDKIYVYLILSHTGHDRCFVKTDGENRRTIYANRSEVRGTFLEAALRDLRRYMR